MLDLQKRYKARSLTVLRLINEVTWMINEKSEKPSGIFFGMGFPKLSNDQAARQLLYLRNGFISEELNEAYTNDYSNQYKKQTSHVFPGELDPIGHLNYSNFFVFHPEKICGEEYGGTGNAFPVLVKGKVEDIVSTIERTVGPKKTFNVNPQVDNANKIKLQIQAKAKAKAILIQMKMNQAA